MKGHFNKNSQDYRLILMQKKQKLDESNNLTRIRKEGTYSSTNLIRGSMINEMHAIFSECQKTNEKNSLRNRVMVDNIVHKNSFYQRENVWRIFDQRYLSCPPWILLSIARPAKEGVNSTDFIGQTYLYYVFRERLVHEFMTECIWSKWKNKQTKIEYSDAVNFFTLKEKDVPAIRQWSEKTIVRCAQSTLAALRDFGILRGTVNKSIQKPRISLEAAFQLLCILKAEGHEGRALIEARDWRLFLLNEVEVIELFTRMSMMKWIRFERSGQTTILELVRIPEESI